MSRNSIRRRRSVLALLLVLPASQLQHDQLEQFIAADALTPDSACASAACATAAAASFTTARYLIDPALEPLAMSTADQSLIAAGGSPTQRALEPEASAHAPPLLAALQFDARGAVDGIDEEPRSFSGLDASPFVFLTQLAGRRVDHGAKPATAPADEAAVAATTPPLGDRTPEPPQIQPPSSDPVSELPEDTITPQDPLVVALPPVMEEPVHVSVPEPSTLSLFALALAGVFAARRARSSER